MEKTNYREHELVVRYVYDVTRRLPEKQRNDLADELSSLIEDMILEKISEEEFQATEKREEEIISEVLTQMGDPAKLARQYRGEEEHLIGGEYYGIYCLVLKIVLLCAGIGYLVSSIVSMFVSAIDMNGVTMMGTDEIIQLAELPGILISAFGSVTLIFIFMEKTKVKIGNTIQWDISKLPMTPSRKAEIKRSDCIVDLIFEAIFLSVFVFAPSVLGLWIVKDQQTICIPVFNVSIWSSIVPIFIISFAMGIIKDAVKLMEGCYNKVVLITTVITSMVSAVCTMWLFTGFELWNPNFLAKTQEAFGRADLSSRNMVIYFGTPGMNTIFMAVILVSIMIDILVAMYRTMRNK